ncbi:MAG TPA: RNA polymerase factor sigma-54 [Afifellaceae bacterium]|nr:RNA polymerase factor sigma-54 [Afifellaceae bacterium]
MALSAKLQIRQQQSLTMTPQLMQAIRLLQMSSVELDRFVEDELAQNPLLSLAEDGDGGAPDTPLDKAGDRSADPSQADASGDNSPERSEDFSDIADVMEPDRSIGSSDLDVSQTDTDPGSEPVGRDRLPQRLDAGGGRPGQSEFTPDIEATLAARPSLTAWLEDQINAMIGDPADRAIALALLSHLDPTGYLTAPLAEIAAALGAPEKRVEKVLLRCQAVEPTGVFARSLAECLALQLSDLNRLDPAMQTLLDNLDLLMNAGRSALQRRCGVTGEDFAEMLEEIRALDPKPGLAFSHDPIAVAVADIIVREGSDGGWTVELNDEVLPRVLVNRSYYAQIAGRANRQERKFVTDCMQQANWLEKSLDQRARTILKVATEIVAQQEAFLRHGVVHLKPLNLRAVADIVGVHESTVSRATANKYMATPRGLFELKFFFSTSIPSSVEGDGHSSEAVKHKVRQLIEAEKPDDILSDDTIVELLGKDGMLIARRTVAKYRGLLKIPSSVQRRRQKRQVLAG